MNTEHHSKTNKKRKHLNRDDKLFINCNINCERL